MEAQGPRKARAPLHLRVPHRHERRRGKGCGFRRFPQDRASEGEETGLRHPADNGAPGASLLRFVRLSGEQFLRPELPFRHPGGIQGPGRRGSRDGHRRHHGHSAFAFGIQRNRGAGPFRRQGGPLLLPRSRGLSSRMGQPLLRLRKGRGDILPPRQLQVLDAGIPSGRIPFRRGDQHALLGPRPWYGLRQL